MFCRAARRICRQNASFLVVNMFLFLDFDGVLHADFAGNPYFSKLPKLVEALDGFSDVIIVVSSAWRLKRSIAELRLLLGPVIGPLVVDKTPHLSEYEHGPLIRQNEIESWLATNAKPWDTWVAIDDMSFEFTPFCPHLIVCDGETGMDDDVVVRLRAYLNGVQSQRGGSGEGSSRKPADGGA